MPSKTQSFIEQVISAVKEQIPRNKLPSMVSKFSHNFRSPLASVITALRVCVTHDHLLTKEQKLEILTQALNQAELLDTEILGILKQLVILPKKDLTQLNSQTHYRELVM